MSHSYNSSPSHNRDTKTHTHKGHAHTPYICTRTHAHTPPHTHARTHTNTYRHTQKFKYNTTIYLYWNVLVSSMGRDKIDPI